MEGVQRVIVAAMIAISCPVCFDEMPQVIVLGCGHSVCRDCLSKLDTCPLCRAVIEHATRSIAIDSIIASANEDRLKFMQRIAMHGEPGTCALVLGEIARELRLGHRDKSFEAIIAAAMPHAATIPEDAYEFPVFVGELRKMVLAAVLNKRMRNLTGYTTALASIARKCPAEIERIARILNRGDARVPRLVARALESDIADDPLTIAMISTSARAELIARRIVKTHKPFPELTEPGDVARLICRANRALVEANTEVSPQLTLTRFVNLMRPDADWIPAYNLAPELAAIVAGLPKIDGHRLTFYGLSVVTLADETGAEYEMYLVQANHLLAPDRDASIAVRESVRICLETPGTCFMRTYKTQLAMFTTTSARRNLCMRRVDDYAKCTKTFVLEDLWAWSEGFGYTWSEVKDACASLIGMEHLRVRGDLYEHVA